MGNYSPKKARFRSRLLAFLWEWDHWATVKGAPHMLPFSRGNGLCNSFEHWIADKESGPMVYYCTDALDQLLTDEFGDSEFPFNKGDALRFIREANSMRMHCNPQRLEWVETTIRRLFNGD